MDKQLLKKFNQFQQKTGKYLDFELDEVEFEEISFSKTTVFTFVKGLNKYIRAYIDHNAGDVPVVGSSLENDCITSYIKPIAESDIIQKPCVSFNKDNAKGSRAFFRYYPFVMDRHHLAIIPNVKTVFVKYLYQFLDYFLQTKSYGWGENVATVDEIQNYSLPIPKSQNKAYTSLKIQEILVEFIEFYQNKTNEKLDIIEDITTKIANAESLLLPLLFVKHPSVCKRFDAFCEGKKIDLKLEDLEFEFKKIHSDSEDELICKKRMGFTPLRVSNGDMNWFTVSDLTKNTGFYIDEPNTKEKTTIELIKKKIPETSDKFIPLKKGDILVSFKLTVGLVKIYNSELPAYCNEAIDILTPFDDIDSRFLAYNCILEYPKYGEKTNNGITLNDEIKKSINIKIPKATSEYTSFQLQLLLVEFIESYFAKMTEKKDFTVSLKQLFTSRNKMIIQKTFKTKAKV